MSRFNWMEGEGDSDSILAYGRWVARRKKVLNGSPGKAALAELEKALLAMPHKRLIEGALCDGEGVCAMGAWIYRKWVDGGMAPKVAWKKLSTTHDPSDEYESYEATIALGQKELGITQTLAEVVSMVNDEEVGVNLTPEQRYERVLAWVRRHKEMPDGED